MPYYSTCDFGTPSYMFFGSIISKKRYASTLATHYTQTLTWTYPRIAGCEASLWLDQGVKAWAIDYVDPNDYEHEYANTFMATPAVSLDSRGRDGYLWWFFLARQYGVAGAQAAPKTFDWLSSTDALTALKTGVHLSTGVEIEEAWKLFSAQSQNLYDRGMTNKPWAWDGIERSADPLVEQYISHGQTVNLEAPPHLSVAAYVIHPSFEVNLIDLQVEPSVDGTISVQVFTVDRRLNLRPALNQPLDLSAGSRMSFCFERPGEDIYEIYIIVGNSSTTSDGDGEPSKVKAFSECGGWQGTYSETRDSSSAYGHRTAVSFGALTFLPDAQGVHTVVRSSVSATEQNQSFVDPACSASASVGGPIDFGVFFADFLLFQSGSAFPGIDPDATLYSFAVEGPVGGKAKFGCGVDTPFVVQFVTPFPTFTSDWNEKAFYLLPGGDTIAGEASSTSTSGPTTSTYSVIWSFERCAYPGIPIMGSDGELLSDCVLN